MATRSWRTEKKFGFGLESQILAMEARMKAPKDVMSLADQRENDPEKRTQGDSGKLEENDLVAFTKPI
jgi:hypothetical protein